MTMAIGDVERTAVTTQPPPVEDAEAATEPVTGSKVGPWVLRRLLGHGGMGAVYLAERTEQDFQQRAALKLIKLGMDSGEIQRRFLSERRILARLEHPNIARLIDGGVDQRGRPYFVMEWVDGNIGSRLTMKYPSVYLMGRKARGEVLSVAYAGKGQHQDAGAKMVHIAPETTSRITNKSVSKDGGKTTYRGLAKVAPGAYGAKINVNCDALILDDRSASDTIPFIEIEEENCTLAHEATVGRIGAEQLFYLMSRGLPEADALSMIVLGFMEPFTRELPMEYAVELNRLIQLEMEGSVG